MKMIKKVSRALLVVETKTTNKDRPKLLRNLDIIRCSPETAAEIVKLEPSHSRSDGRRLGDGQLASPYFDLSIVLDDGSERG